MTGLPRWAWIDLETTGLDESRPGAAVLEVALVVTDPRFQEVDRRHVVIHAPDAVFDDWAAETHRGNGLIQECRKSRCSLAEAEELALALLAEYFPPAAVPMCGASVHFDRRWLHVHMPRLHDHFHFGNLDVSSVQRLVETVRPDLRLWPDPPGHRALPDVLDEIRQASFYAGLLGSPGGWLRRALGLR